jgi:hypothetical protein
MHKHMHMTCGTTGIRVVGVECPERAGKWYTIIWSLT